ncbi:hypothetical protein [Pseudactinotalea terrae]|uniref:hypothetical protein n=1 Tax=Pseudactinotalea terrae TaxID=1743262 RepID=UPI0012E0CCD7|nr:hypothetical protein [Pseudactinotalea terrae]
MQTSNLLGAWERFWGVLSGANGVGTLFTILAVVGVLLIVGSGIKFLWDKRRGGGANSKALIWTIIAGAVLAGPNLFIPLILRLVDIVVNVLANIIRGLS